jgi:hypothetical protein
MELTQPLRELLRRLRDAMQWLKETDFNPLGD